MPSILWPLEQVTVTNMRVIFLPDAIALRDVNDEGVDFVQVSTPGQALDAIKRWEQEFDGEFDSAAAEREFHDFFNQPVAR